MQQLFTFIVHHWFWVSILVLLLLALTWLEAQGKVGGMKKISPNTLIFMMNKQNATVIDIRDRDQYHKGHIAGSLSISHDELEHKDLTAYAAKPVIIVCSSGVSAPKLGKLLTQKGLTQLHFLQGGMTGWATENLPVVKK